MIAKDIINNLINENSVDENEELENSLEKINNRYWKGGDLFKEEIASSISLKKQKSILIKSLKLFEEKTTDMFDSMMDFIKEVVIYIDGE